MTKNMRCVRSESVAHRKLGYQLHCFAIVTQNYKRNQALILKITKIHTYGRKFYRRAPLQCVPCSAKDMNVVFPSLNASFDLQLLSNTRSCLRLLCLSFVLSNHPIQSRIESYFDSPHFPSLSCFSSFYSLVVSVPQFLLLSTSSSGYSSSRVFSICSSCPPLPLTFTRPGFVSHCLVFQTESF